MAAKIAVVSNIAPKRTLASLIAREHVRKRRRILLSLAGVSLVVVIVVAAVLAFRPRPVPIPDRFRTYAVSRGDLVREVTATGHLEAVTTVQVGAELSGRIESVLVDYNDRVHAGQVLARFDRAALEAQLAQSRALLSAGQAALEQAKTDQHHAQRSLERATAIYATHSITDAAFEDAHAAQRLALQRALAAQADLAARRASYELMRTNYDHAVILAPIDGIVITRNVDPGQTVVSALQTPVLFTVAADLRQMHVIAAVDEADIGEVQPGQHASFTVHAYPNRTFEAEITEVRNSAQNVQDVITYGVELLVDNADLSLRPGMTASVRIRTKEARAVLRVPAAALSFTPPAQRPASPTGVWALRGDRLQHLPVHTGVSDGELTEVAGDDLMDGSAVLVELTPEGRRAYDIAH